MYAHSTYPASVSCTEEDVLKLEEDCHRFVCIKHRPDTQYFHRWHCFIAEETDGLFAAQKQ